MTSFAHPRRSRWLQILIELTIYSVRPILEGPPATDPLMNMFTTTHSACQPVDCHATDSLLPLSAVGAADPSWLWTFKTRGRLQ